MHRSGTSALTRVLAFCGMAIPRTLVPADQGNLAGHWESRVICRFNDRLLARLGLDWISWEAAPAELASEGDYELLVRIAAQILLYEYGESGDIVLKDPRICRLLPFWLDVLERLDIDPAVVLALRAPDQVARSLKRRNAILTGYGLRAWLRFTLDAERASRHLPRAVVSFDQLMSDWRSAAAALDSGVGTDMLGSITRAEADVAAFLSADLRHFGEETGQAGLPQCIARVYSILSQWQHRAATAEDHAELDATRKRLDEAARMSLRYNAAGWCLKWLSRQAERLGEKLNRPPCGVSTALRSA
jgi:hypothetical protein